MAVDAGWQGSGREERIGFNIKFLAFPALSLHSSVTDIKKNDTCLCIYVERGRACRGLTGARS